MLLKHGDHLLVYQVIYTDVALDPYSSDGHDGIVREDGKTDMFHTLLVARNGVSYLKHVIQ